MIAEMMQNFMGSAQGQSAMQALAGHGFDPAQVQAIMGHAVNGTTEHLSSQTAGSGQPEVGLFNIFGGHAGREALLGAISGLFKGDGVGGSIKDGGAAVLTGHLSEYLASKAGLNPTQAGQIAAMLTPYIGSFVHDHLQGKFGSVLAGLL